MAMIAGMRAAYQAMLEYFNPDGLADEFDKGLKRNVLSGVLNKTKYWDLYEDLYRHLQNDPEASFHRLFGREFGRAYEEQMARLSNMRGK
jgi:type VI secretion system protein ImpI